MTKPALGTVTIAPDVLSTIVSLTAEAVPGVARLGSVPGQQRVGTILGSGASNASGVVVRVNSDEVTADCYLIAEPEINLIQLGTQVQEAVGEALSEMIGMPVRAVNVYVQDVEEARG